MQAPTTAFMARSSFMQEVCLAHFMIFYTNERFVNWLFVISALLLLMLCSTFLFNSSCILHSGNYSSAAHAFSLATGEFYFGLLQSSFNLYQARDVPIKRVMFQLSCPAFVTLGVWQFVTY